jgi:transcription initiation factor IIE alpha subunit
MTKLTGEGDLQGVNILRGKGDDGQPRYTIHFPIKKEGGNEGFFDVIVTYRTFKELYEMIWDFNAMTCPKCGAELKMVERDKHCTECRWTWYNHLSQNEVKNSVNDS